jgi:ribosomal protein S27AE
MSNNVKLKDVKIYWEDCSLSMDCPYCGEEIILDTQNEPIACGKCGHIFQLMSDIYEIVQKKKK